MKNILFVGDLNEYGRSFQRCRVLREMGYSVTAFSHTPVPFRPGIDKNHNLWLRLRWRLGWPVDMTGINCQIKNILRREYFDVIWIEKCLTIWPGTLKFIKKMRPVPKLVWCSEDDMAVRHNQSVFFKRGLRFYDIVFTTKVYNLSELKELGARRTKLFLDAYDEKLHRPLTLSDKDIRDYGCDVGFIGSFEKERAESMLYLAERGIPVTVWGNGWKDLVNKNPNLVVKNKPVYSEEYAKAINATKINLCFLRKINRDEITSRSVEIPACGGFMLGERTKRHLEFFKESKEAEFFSSKEELLEKVKRFLTDESARRRIASAGLARCFKSGYNHRVQLERMFQELFSL